MNRHYDTTQYRAVAEAVRKAFPGAALTTDMMVGFAGETEVDHQELSLIHIWYRRKQNQSTCPPGWVL